MQLDLISMEEANRLLTTAGDAHYLGPVKYPPYYCLSTPERDAVATYGAPIASSFKKEGGLEKGQKIRAVLELTRLWRSRQSRLHTMQFMAATLRWVRNAGRIKEKDADREERPQGIISYADPRPGVAHTGKIYTDTGWIYLGRSTVTQEFVSPLDCEFEIIDFKGEKPDRIYFPTGKYAKFKAGQRVTLPKAYRVFKTKAPDDIVKITGWMKLDSKAKYVFLYPFVKGGRKIGELIGRFPRYAAAAPIRHTAPLLPKQDITGGKDPVCSQSCTASG